MTTEPMYLRRLLAFPLLSVLALTVLVGCAPKVDEDASRTNTKAGAGAADESTTGTGAATTDTTLTIEHRAGPAPFKLPFPDALAAEDIKPGKRGGNFTFGYFGEGPKTFNPITGNDSASGDLGLMMFSSLINLDYQTQKFSPGLLKEWYMEDNKAHWILKLREGIKWSDGHPITADDILFTIQVIYDPKILNALRDILQMDGKPVEFEKVDALTVRAKLPRPSASFQAMLPFQIVPKHAYEEAYKAGTFATMMNTDSDPAKFVCSGPFKLKQYFPGERVVMERNPHYFRYDSNGTQLPYLDTMIISYAPNMDQMLLRFKGGEVDGITRPSQPSLPDLQDNAAKGNYTVHDAGPGTASDLLWFNLKEGTNPKSGNPYVAPWKSVIFRDVRFRRAMLHSIDRESIIRTELRGQAELGKTCDSSANKLWFKRDVPVYDYNPGKAKALLEEMNLKDRDGDGIREDAQGNKVSFTIITNKGNQRRERFAPLLTQDMRQVGIEARTDFMDFNALLSLTDESYEYEGCILGLAGGSTHPANKMNTFLSTARTNLYNPRQEKPATDWGAEVDKLCAEFNSTLDPGFQLKAYHRIQEIHAQQLPTLPLWYPKVFVACSNKYENIKPAATTPELIWNAEEFFVK
ncbi:MAG: ABC transporter substrate-binding protein [Candidatus Sumerlaeaceae bacterium]